MYRYNHRNANFIQPANPGQTWQQADPSQTWQQANPSQTWQQANPSQTWQQTTADYQTEPLNPKEERIAGGFLLPFLTGAVVSAPFWYLGANNKAQQSYCHNCQSYPYPMYYPYKPTEEPYPSYYPYPPYPPYGR